MKALKPCNLIACAPLLSASLTQVRCGRWEHSGWKYSGWDQHTYYSEHFSIMLAMTYYIVGLHYNVAFHKIKYLQIQYCTGVIYYELFITCKG